MKYLVLFSFLLCARLSWSQSFNGSATIENADGQTFDYIVIGCGIAGLVVSARLSEDEDVSILCLEAGTLDQGEDEILYPYYIGLQPYGFYLWNVYTVPQDHLDGNSRYVPIGKGVGGGSLINGLIWNRGNQDSYDAWNELGNDGWGWNDLLPYFEKSETYTPKRYNTSTLIEPHLQNSSVHGKSGPMHISYPEYYWPQADNFFAALEELNIPLSAEPNEGLEAGGYFIPLNIHPELQIRWDARRGYYDPNINRTNFNVQVNSQVTRIIFEDNAAEVLNATAVEYASGPDASRQTAFARREVILAAGAIQSAQLLELSGIGQASVLEPLGIEVLENLPGVGNNLQDHPMLRLSYDYSNTSYKYVNDFLRDPEYNEQCRAEFFASRTGPWTAKPSGAVAFPSLRQVTDDGDVDSRIARARSAPNYLPSNYENEPTLQTGYLAQFISTLNDLNQSYTPAFENLNDNGGGLHLALMRPLSRGTTHITTSNPFDLPAVDPRWLEHPFDFETMILALQTNERILNTEAIQILQPTYPDVPKDADEDTLAELLRTGIGTQFHYSGTAAMLPRSMGGVVSDELIVYGTHNLRVVDTSIFPMVPGAHTAAVAFGAAEKAADIIKGLRVAPEDTDTDTDNEEEETTESPSESGSARLSSPIPLLLRDKTPWLALLTALWMFIAAGAL